MATIEGTAEKLADEHVEPRTGLVLVTLPSIPAPMLPIAPVQAETDETMILLWLDGLRPHTRRAYEADIKLFRNLVGKPLQQVTLRDLQGYKAMLATVEEATGKPRLASATQARRLSSVKSLLTAAHELGYLTLNIGSRIKLPPIKQTLAERILSQEDVIEMLALERDPRKGNLARALRRRTATKRDLRLAGPGSAAQRRCLPDHSLWQRRQNPCRAFEGEPLARPGATSRA